MPALGQRTPPHIRALDRTLIGDGYGSVYINDGSRSGATALAHRVVYEGLVGPIPEGMLLCHHCDNPKCVRPDHIFVGTDADNKADMYAKGRHASGDRLPQGAKTHCLRGHPFSGENLYRWRNRRRCRACMRIRDRLRRQTKPGTPA